MANNNNYLEEGRPPEPPPELRCSSKRSSPRDDSWSHHPDNINNNQEESYRSLKEKLFCIKKRANNFSDKSASNSVCDNNNPPSSSRNRNSFHQDVEEALNSLLWQPYEYQNKQSSRSCTSSSSSFTYSDLDESPNKGPLHEENTTDLNLSSEMVNNLKRPVGQSQYVGCSRDALSCNAASRLNSQVSLVECFNAGTAAACSVSDCDVLLKNSDMQFEVPPNDGTSNPGTILNIPTESDGLIRTQNITLYPNSTSLSSANVVGLPETPRRASVPSGTTIPQIRNSPGNNLVFPNHLRNVSEPSTMSANNQFRYNQPNVVPVIHQRNNSQVEQNFIAHLRSSSVPKSMGTTVNHQRINSDINRNNVSNVNVNFYRAVPVNVVSSVPTIQCSNTNSDEGNNVSNVHIMPLGSTQAFNSAATGTTQVTVHNSQPPTVNVIQREANRNLRTFTSTEAQTDEITVCPPPNGNTDTTIREQKRKERRERRHQRRSNNHRHTVDSGTQANTLQNDRLPDLLHSHMPPPYSPLPNNVPPNVVMVPPPPVLQTVVPNNVVPNGLLAFPSPQVVGGQVPLVQGSGPVPVPVPAPSGFRFQFPSGGFRRGRFSEEPPKGCCGLLAWKPGSLRWFIAVIALIAVCCVLVGTALGAMRPAGRDHLTVSLLMIGVGIVLVTVSGIAWKLTSHDSSTCRSMLGLGSTESVDVCTRRFVPRLPPSYGRPHHPYAAMMYPEFQYRPPPPSYQASMQEYRLRLLLLDRGNTPQIQAGIQNAVSPPPTYRSHAGSLLRAPLSSRRDATQSEYSCPPSYRSQTSSNRQGTLQNSVLHSREHSLSLSESNNGEPMVNVVNILGSTEADIALDNMTLDSLKMEPESDINPLKMLLKGSSSDLEGTKDENLVTIVQTSDRNPVIVTVSGSSQIEGNTVQVTDISSPMEILAHL